MLKCYDYAITFAEFPDEVSFCVNVSGCPGQCPHCSEPWLREDVGTPMTDECLDFLLEKSFGCSNFGLLGGDADHEEVKRIAKYVHEHSSLKFGFYSGRDFLDLSLVPFVDFYKIGRWIFPEGEEKDWSKKNCGPLSFPFSNQLYFEKIDNCLINATDKFRKIPQNNLGQYLVKNNEKIL